LTAALMSCVGETTTRSEELAFESSKEITIVSKERNTLRHP
jgi:hypothetical protein